MVSVAIVIAVSSYSTLGSLRGCARDGEAMRGILKESGKYSEILYLHDKVTGSIKDDLSDFFDRWRDKDIDELFFYFSGHGQQDEGGSSYLLSDFDFRNARKASLESRYIDGLARTLSPRVFVKIIDACNSGVTYIKGQDDKKISESSLIYNDGVVEVEAGFRNLYFLFSSQSDQKSYQTENISFFTESVLRSLKEIGGEVRYIRMVDYISDFFGQHGRQTPAFITQGGGTDKFIEVSESVERVIDHYAKGGLSDYTEEQRSEKTLAQIILDQDQMSCSEEEVVAVLDNLREAVMAFSLSDDLEELFDISFDFEGGLPPFSYMVGLWIAENSSVAGYFAQPYYEYREVKKRVPRNILGIHWLSSKDDDEHYMDKYENERYVSGYKNNVKLPYQHISVKISPRTRNLHEVRYFIAPIVSVTGIRIFYGGANYSLVDWNNRRISSRLKYQSSEFVIKSNQDWSDFICILEQDFLNCVETPIRDQWQIPTM